MRPVLRSSLLILFSAIAGCAGAPAIRAGDTPAKLTKEPDVPWRKTWFGADIAASSWSIYTGTTYAPFGSIHKDGLRLRMVGGYGRYSYDGTRYLGRTVRQERFKGQHGFGEILVGYQYQLGALTLKGFVGGAGIGHAITPLDPDSPTLGTRYGITAAIEGWYDITEVSWLSANAGWSSVFQTFKADMRFGYRLTRSIDLGLEAAGNHNSHYADGRVGGFAQYRWGSAELRLSSGWAVDDNGNSGAYGMLNFLYTY